MVPVYLLNRTSRHYNRCMNRPNRHTIHCKAGQSIVSLYSSHSAYLYFMRFTFFAKTAFLETFQTPYSYLIWRIYLQRKKPQSLNQCGHRVPGERPSIQMRIGPSHRPIYSVSQGNVRDLSHCNYSWRRRMTYIGQSVCDSQSVIQCAASLSIAAGRMMLLQIDYVNTIGNRTKIRIIYFS